MEEKKHTAEEVNRHAMRKYEYCSAGDKKRNKATYEQAMDYIHCLNILAQYYNGIIPDDGSLTEHNIQALSQRIADYGSMNLDMRDIEYEEKGMTGLKSVTGKVLVAPELGYAHFPERYDHVYQGWRCHCWGCPVVGKNGKYGLVQFACGRNRNKSKLIVDFEYDQIFRYFGYSYPLFVCEKDGKQGLVELRKGNLVLPCEQDIIYDNLDFDGCIEFRKDGKFGLFFMNKHTEAIFDEVEITSEDYSRARIGNVWYWINEKGEPTDKVNEAYFGSWYDCAR